MRLKQVYTILFESVKGAVKAFVKFASKTIKALFNRFIKIPYNYFKQRPDTSLAVLALIISIYTVFRDNKKNAADLKAAEANQIQDSIRYSRQIELGDKLHNEQLKSQRQQTDSLVVALDRIKTLADQSQQKLSLQILTQEKQIQLLYKQLALTRQQVSQDEETGKPQLFIFEIQAFRDYRTSYKTLDLNVTVKNTGIRPALNINYKAIVIYNFQRDSIFDGGGISSLANNQDWRGKVKIGTPEKNPAIFSVYQHLLPANSYDQRVYFVVMLTYSDGRTGTRGQFFYYRNDNMYPRECTTSETSKLQDYLFQRYGKTKQPETSHRHEKSQRYGKRVKS